jgi:uncharacterized protein YecT (DUF1311 family)
MPATYGLRLHQDPIDDTPYLGPEYADAVHHHSLVCLFTGSARAQMFGAGYDCDRPTSLQIQECIQNEIATWDARLNSAYQTLEKSVDPSQREPLKTAERQWVVYRDANCKFYGLQEGTIAALKAAECKRAMTQSRASELEDAAKP